MEYALLPAEVNQFKKKDLGLFSNVNSKLPHKNEITRFFVNISQI